MQETVIKQAKPKIIKVSGSENERQESVGESVKEIKTTCDIIVDERIVLWSKMDSVATGCMVVLLLGPTLRNNARSMAFAMAIELARSIAAAKLSVVSLI